MARLLIFDWDGTLSDSLDRIAHCLRLASQEIGLPVPSVAAARNIVGLGLYDATERLFPGIDREQVHALRDCYARHFVREDEIPCPFYPGVLDTLEKLRDNGHLLAVATGKTRKGMDRVLQATALGGFFHSTRTADETASKPNPKMLHALLDEFSLPVDDALMIGDTEYDMQMAHSIEMPRLAVSYGAHEAHKLLPFQPVACVDDFKKIIEIINKTTS